MMQFPLWNWGQRDAGQNLAVQAKNSSSLYGKAIRLQVAGLVRSALWDLKIQSNRHDLAGKVYKLSNKLTHTVERRVSLGDLPRADLLLAKSELLTKRSELVNAEAEEMHARKRYTTLTRMETIPGGIDETQSPFENINTEHPMLAALNANIQRKKAELKWIKAEGNGQPIVGLGGKSDREARIGDGATGMSFSIIVPFGGSTFSGPEIAEVNMELNQAIVERDHYYRQLEKAFHEAAHALEVDRAELKISSERKKIAQEHLKITQLSFDSGEIDLFDLLKIQERSYAAIQQASEQALVLQRDIALYNQAVGVLP
jgi:outer membrane protein TolC